MTEPRLPIATAPSRTSVHWRNRTPTWAAVVSKLIDPVLQTEGKDHGGYVAGHLRDGLRRAGHVECRSMITLDADSPGEDFVERVDGWLVGTAYVLHETWSSRPSAPRWRLVVPLSGPLTPEQYVPAALALMARIGLDDWDPTTAQPERLMYWPARPGRDYACHVSEGLPLDGAELLTDYDDWTDASQWPDVGHKYVSGERKKAGDPREKNGIVGAFCRAYSVPEAIEAFIPDAYSLVHDDRWTWNDGHGEGGMVVYDDGAFAYSNHGSDPAYGRLLNAFDLVRVHMFAGLDDKADIDGPPSSLPSHKAMIDLAGKDRAVRVELDRARSEEALADFSGVQEEEANGDTVTDDQQAMIDRLSGALDRMKDGRVWSSARNIALILAHDPRIAGMVGRDLFAHRLMVRRPDLPWRQVSRTSQHWSDDDDACLRVWLETTWEVASVGRVADALVGVAEDNAFHPVRDYLRSLEWDGVPRLETLMIDYLGAVDTEYTRMVTRKALVAAVCRVMVPGTKFDHMIVTTGPQGVGKSFLPMRLARGWYKDSDIDLRSKDAYEALEGAWIFEFSELSAMRKAEVERIKSFISSSEDSYRQAYGRRSVHRPRQVLFWGTTNEPDFLRDRTGNRRFWPVPVTGVLPRGPWDLTDDDIDQIWAEARELWEAGESLVLTGDETTAARAVQDAHTEVSDLDGLIAAWLDSPVPEGWRDLDRTERDLYAGTGGCHRDIVCSAEVSAEMLGERIGTTHPARSSAIRSALDRVPGWVRVGRVDVGGGYGVQLAWRRVDSTG